jgi:1,4-alpha-glucan branching enzyme
VTSVADEILTKDDIYLFNEGRHFRLYEHLGAHCVDGGVAFAVWAPNAARVSVVGDRNGWDPSAAPLSPRESSGIWVGKLDGWGVGDRYKFHIEARNGYRVDKADPFAFEAEQPPATASVVAYMPYEWNDSNWMATRGERQQLDSPISIYEVHLGSWRRDANGDWLSYREVAPALAQYAKEHGFTHVELLPIMEHPFYGSWGYQTTGYFAPTSRYGAPTDFMYFVDLLHSEGIGVILDWVPSHFPSDEHGLAYFDGTHLFEHEDPRQGFHPDWNSLIFNYGRSEVRSFLISSGCFWLDRYHVDGLRVDAVASMLYLDYSRKQGEWVPNKYGGRENLEAISFLRELNEAVYGGFPDTQTYAEESTAWPMVSRPTYLGGLGFGMKWDMGWMHDTLQYFERDPIHRRYHHNELTFRAIYANSENYVLPLSHDEVVHGKGSIASKMPGDKWQKLANVRLLYSYQWALPAKKLLFMGAEVGQWREWDHEASVEWHLLDDDQHAGVARLVGDLNRLYAAEAPLFDRDTEDAGFQWAVADDGDNSTLAFLRFAQDGSPLLWVGNFTPVPRYNFRAPVPVGGRWVEVLNSDATSYGGSGVGNYGAVDALPVPLREHFWSLTLTVPPLGALFLRPERVLPTEPVPATELPREPEP